MALYSLEKFKYNHVDKFQTSYTACSEFGQVTVHTSEQFTQSFINAIARFCCESLVYVCVCVCVCVGTQTSLDLSNSF